jgi:predicted transcriptional regulator
VLEQRVDSPSVHLYAYFMNLHVPPELEAKLDRLAAATGRRPDQLALDLLASSVDHDDWFREEVEKGRESARAGRLLDPDEVASRINQRYGA